MLNKKQIVFVESFFNVPTFNMAYALKKTKKYETVLILLAKHDKKIFEKAFDKIFIFDLKFNLTPKGLINFFKKIKSKEGKKFLAKIKKINPHVFQITGPDLVTLWFMHFLKKKVKVYYAYDIWKFYDKKFSFKKNSGIMQFFHKYTERICFKMADGILHKCSPKMINLLKLKSKTPELSFLPCCLDEWNYSIKEKRKNKELHIVYAGRFWDKWKGHISFPKIIKDIISQKIHFHIYDLLTKEFKENLKNINKKYLHLHKLVSIDKLNKEISKYDYGYCMDFTDDSIVNPLWRKAGIANKLFSYIGAGLPTIANEQLEYIAKIVRDNNIGITIKDFKDLKNLRKILEKQNYGQLQKNVRKAQEKFKLSKNIEKLERFYEKVVEMKR